jgi:chromosomal replication initiator protein
MTESELSTLWNSVLDELRTTVSTTNYNMLFRPTHLLSLDDDIATISAPNQMSSNLLQSRFLTQIKQFLDKHTGRDISILLVVKPGKKKVLTETQTPLFDQMEDTRGSQVTHEAPTPVVPSVRNLPRVREEYTFSSFAVSGSNQLAFVSAQKVANSIGYSYNPFFIYGPVGVGKTHLMHAIANDVYKKDPTKKIIYITSEEFTNEVVDAIRNNDTAKMKKKFRNAYLLLIDDIQFIEGKDRVQEELFHTFNILIDNRSQICLTSDRPPQEIKKLEKRLSSRFAGGLTVDIESPDLELKAAILLKKAEKLGYTIPTEVGMFLGENAEDTRSLEGLLLRVITQATADNSEITMEIAQKALGKAIEEKTRDKREHLHADDIIKYVCTFYNVKPTALKGPKRDASLVKARQVTMYLLKKELGLPLAEIGNLLGGRDHTTIMHGVEKIENLVDNKAKISEDILGITRTLKG